MIYFPKKISLEMIKIIKVLVHKQKQQKHPMLILMKEIEIVVVSFYQILIYLNLILLKKIHIYVLSL